MNNKTRFSALMLAVVMMVSLLSAFPFVGSAVDYSKDFTADLDYGTDDYATLNISGPTEVNLGDDFEITITWNDIQYEQLNDVVGSADVYFYVDTRYIQFNGLNSINDLVLADDVENMSSLHPTKTCDGKDYMQLVKFSVAFKTDAAREAVSDTLIAKMGFTAIAAGTTDAAVWNYAMLSGVDTAAGGYTVVVEDGNPAGVELGYVITVTDGGTVVPPVNEYTVNFVGFDGADLGSQTVVEGGAAVAPEAPEVRGYTFKGWDVAFDNITADTTVTAIYEAITYTVYFQDKDGNVFAQETVAYGAAATAPTAPAVEGYTFTGWDVAFDAIYGDTYVTAQYEINKYTVTFVGFGGAVLDEQTVEHGAAAIAPEAPVVEGWTFNGWDVDFSNITGDLTVTAKYLENMPNVYTVNFVGFDGADLGSQDVVEGAAATAPEAPAVEGYTFKGWDVDFSNITGNLTVTAIYEINKYTVNFVGFEGADLGSVTVEHGAAAVAPTAPAVEGYTFTGWDVAFDNVTGDLTVTAVYEINFYTVTFVVGAQGTAEGQLEWTVEYGTAGSAITAPTVTSTNAAYAFDGWDKEIPATITEDIVITAKFVTTGSTVSVNFVQGANGTILGTDDAGQAVVGDYTITVASGVAAGSAFVTPNVVADDNYHFAGWYVGDELYDFNTILDGDLTLTAKFELNSISIDSFTAGTVGGMGVAAGKLNVTLNEGVVPENVKVVTFYQTGDGRTSITIDDLEVVEGEDGAYIEMLIVPGSYVSFDVYLVDGDIDWSAADWNVIDVYTGAIIPAA